eukprot:TRINITY_DN60169_c0_g1_i1.p1 TRINITY_DN60169_c0_g1~~TRINITY_DN60169_c0_g1_i1.p1  ORF type:complete len:180 (+),score=40.52 TRINITY_DN60169_c0_g1_i1:78-542(+)
MPASGVNVNADCFTQFKDLKEKKKTLCVIYGFSSKEMDEIIVIKTEEKTDEDEETHVDQILNNFVEGLTLPHYIVWDLKLPTKSSADAKGAGVVQKTETLVFTGLCLDTMTIKAKMMFSSSVKALLDSLVGIPKKVDLRSKDECNYKYIVENAK